MSERKLELMSHESAVAFAKRDPLGFLHELTRDRHGPVFRIERDPLAAALQAGDEPLGAKGISVADALEPFQICLPLYIGATTPRARSEVPHWHPDQPEVYVILGGEAEMLAKFRWDDDGWSVHEARPGDVLVVLPEVCHWFRWRSQSEDSLALVFKAPQRAGVGRFPNGKVTCQFCPHFQRGCMLPSGFSVPYPKAA